MGHDLGDHGMVTQIKDIDPHNDITDYGGIIIAKSSIVAHS